MKVEFMLMLSSVLVVLLFLSTISEGASCHTVPLNKDNPTCYNFSIDEQGQVKFTCQYLDDESFKGMNINDTDYSQFPEIHCISSVEGNTPKTTCPFDRSIASNSNFSCVIDDIISPDPPTGFCRPPRPPENGEINETFYGSPETSYLAMVTFGCQEGYHIDGPTNLTCGKNGQFSSCLTVCTQDETNNGLCRLPRPPENGFINETFFGSPETSMVTFGCQEGYHIDGPTNLSCGKNGHFPRHLPVCIQDLLYALHALLLPVFLVFLVLLALTPVVYLKRNRIRKWCNAKTVNDESRTKTAPPLSSTTSLSTPSTFPAVGDGSHPPTLDELRNRSPSKRHQVYTTEVTVVPKNGWQDDNRGHFQFEDPNACVTNAHHPSHFLQCMEKEEVTLPDIPLEASLVAEVTYSNISNFLQEQMAKLETIPHSTDAIDLKLSSVTAGESVPCLCPP